MTLGGHLRTVLLQLKYISETVGDKIFPTINDVNSAPPMICYAVTEYEAIEDFSGTRNEGFSTVEFHCFAGNYDDAEKLKIAIWHQLKEYRGDLEDCKIKQIQLVSDQDAPWEEDDETFRRILAVRIWHTEAIPTFLHEG